MCKIANRGTEEQPNGDEEGQKEMMRQILSVPGDLDLAPSFACEPGSEPYVPYRCTDARVSSVGEERLSRFVRSVVRSRKGRRKGPN
ncbi:hypothetical protein ZHAS_00004293 [Anopheles sinensis]|uniref:Uncharacterized protein n=1 Tax=Anopheles sinensis TaxID=74873 RepID=A0A084VGJ2_ANOSI|nr:hypothetical protein ZHAS_00004293 [Anopheles sinensis]